MVGAQLQRAITGKSETFDLFSQSASMEDLGMLDPKKAVLEVTIAGRDFEITQSPGMLQSQREGGTTGAAVWQSIVRFAEWLESSSNPLFGLGLLDATSVVLELGAGVSGILPCILSKRVHKVVSTDQAYTLKALQNNISTNLRETRVSAKVKTSLPAIEVLPLDWETDDALSFLRSAGLDSGVHMIVACDCIYNYALLAPFVQTCADLCRARCHPSNTNEDPKAATLCVIVQQLRQSEVFDQWLAIFRQRFRVWRVPSNLLSKGLQEGSGFAVHVGIVRQDS